MSLFTKILVIVVAGAFFLVGLFALVDGAYGAALGGLLFGSVVALVGGIGWFETKFPLPHLPRGTRPSLISDAQRYLSRYPGFPGKIAAGFIGLLLSLAVFGIIGRIAGW